MNEVKILRRCQRGDKQAFNELITFYFPFVTKFLFKMTKNSEVTEEVRQEVFIKLIKNIDKFNLKGKASFSTYLMTIAKNCYLDYVRRTNRELYDLSIDDVSNKAFSEYDYFKYEDYNTLLKEIDSLPKEQREVIKLKYLEGYTLKEIARVQKVSSKTVKSRLFESRKKLRDKLKGFDLYE